MARALRGAFGAVLLSTIRRFRDNRSSEVCPGEIGEAWLTAHGAGTLLILHAYVRSLMIEMPTIASTSATERREPGREYELASPKAERSGG